MKKKIIILISLLLVFIPKLVLTSVTAQSQSIEFDSGYLLKNNAGNKGVDITHPAEWLTLKTGIEINFKFIKFSETLFTDIFTIKLLTADGDGLMLSFYYEITENSKEGVFCAQYNQEDEKINSNIFKENNKDFPSEMSLTINYAQDKYCIELNNNIIELPAAGLPEKNAVLSLKLASGDENFVPEILILGAVLKASEDKKEESAKNNNTVDTENQDTVQSDNQDKEITQPSTAALVQETPQVLGVLVVAVPLIFLLIKYKRRVFK